LAGQIVIACPSGKSANVKQPKTFGTRAADVWPCAKTHAKTGHFIPSMPTHACTAIRDIRQSIPSTSVSECAPNDQGKHYEVARGVGYTMYHQHA
jgi:hypothetical protein